MVTPKPMLRSMERRVPIVPGACVLAATAGRVRVMGSGGSSWMMGRHGDGLCGADGAARNGTPCAREGPPGGVGRPGATLRRRDCQIRGACLVPLVVGTSWIPGLIRTASARCCPDGASSLPGARRPQEDAARTRCWATSGGSSTRSSRCSSTACWSASSSTATGRGLRLFMFSAILPWKWFEATVKDGVAVDHVAGAADQADLLPEARPAGRGGRAPGVVNFAFGLIPLVGLMLAALRRPAQPVAAAHPGRRGRSSSCSRWRSRSRCRRPTCSTATSATSSRHLLRFWFYLSPTLYSPERSSIKLELRAGDRVGGGARTT